MTYSSVRAACLAYLAAQEALGEVEGPRLFATRSRCTRCGGGPATPVQPADRAGHLLRGAEPTWQCASCHKPWSGETDWWIRRGRRPREGRGQRPVGIEERLIVRAELLRRAKVLEPALLNRPRRMTLALWRFHGFSLFGTIRLGSFADAARVGGDVMPESPAPWTPTAVARAYHRAEEIVGDRLERACLLTGGFHGRNAGGLRRSA